MGVGDWRQALLDGLEREMLEGKSSVGVGVHPDKKGLYMSWGFFALLVGLVTLIVAAVAYMAYKHGAEAMVNMSNITRKGSIAVRLSRANSASGVAATTNFGNVPSVTSTDGRESPPLERVPTLQHGATVSSMMTTTSRPWTATGSGSSSPPDLLREQRRRHPSREVSIQRVHSLPALGHANSPTTPKDRYHIKGGWRPLFDSNARASADGALVRRTSADGVEGHNAKDRDRDSAGDVVVGACGGEETARGNAPGMGSSNYDAAGQVPGAAGVPLDSVSERARSGASSLESPRSASGASACAPSPSPSRRGHGAKRECEAQDGGPGSTGSGSTGSGSARHGRQERQLSRDERHRSSGHARVSRDSEEAREQDAVDGSRAGSRNDGTERGSARRDRNSSRSRSRSPRAVLQGGDDEPMVLGGGGSTDKIGEDGAPEALLVTNRRLRTEFVEGPKLGRGGFGTVYKCRNRLDGHDYAVKKVRLSSDRRWQQQLAKVLREVKILALLDHPNIVRYYQAWLEKFTEEDERYLRGQTGPSVTTDTTDNSALWDPTTGGTRTDHIPTGTTNNTANHNQNAGPNAFPSAFVNGDEASMSSRDGYNGVYGPHSPLFLTGGAALQRTAGLGKDLESSGVGDSRRQKQLHQQYNNTNNKNSNWSGSPSSAAFVHGITRRLSEELSVDGWSVDSRNTDGRGECSGGSDGVRGLGIGRRMHGVRAGSRFGRFDREGGGEGDEDDDDEEDDDASMPGFVFDREGTEDNNEGDNGGVGVDNVGGGNGNGDGDGDVEGIKDSGTGGAGAGEEGGEGRSAGSSGAGMGTGTEARIKTGAGNGTGAGDGVEDRAKGGKRSGDNGEVIVVGCTNSDDMADGRRPSGSTAPASSYTAEPSCPNRVDTDSVSARARPGCRFSDRDSGDCNSGGRGGGSGDLVVNGMVGSDMVADVRDEPHRSCTARGVDVDKEAQNTQSSGSECDRGHGDGEGRQEIGNEAEDDASDHDYDDDEYDDHDDDDSVSWNSVRPLPPAAAVLPIISNGHHRSESLTSKGGAAIAAAAAVAAGASAGAAGAASGDSNRRPRGKSWPQNPEVMPSEGGSEVTTLREKPAHATAFPGSGQRKRGWGRGAWGRGKGGRGRGNVRVRPRATKEVYDLWLYIQMQYCSHNNLQYFLEENPDRRAQTRVDMPQVMHIFLQVAKGLQYVHACGLIHRDLKPANCFLMADGTVKIGDFGLSRHILPAHGINGGLDPRAAVDASAEALVEAESNLAAGVEQLGWASGDDASSITGGVGTYLYGSPEQMSGQGYDEKTDIYSLGMLLFEMCHPPFGTKMERTIVLTNAHRLVFPTGDAWGPPRGQEPIKNLCRSMLQRASVARPSAADMVRQVELMQGKHMLLQLDKKPPASYSVDGGGRPDVAIVLRVEALEQEGLLHRLVDLIRALCRGQAAYDAARAVATGTGSEGAAVVAGGDGGARLEQYGLRGHTGSAVMEFLIAGAALEEREAIIAALESLPEVHSVREFPANG